MAFNGTGTFLRLYNWVTDKTNSVPITASRVDAEMDGMATGLSSCITKDGQTTITANIPFNSFKATGLGVGTARTDAINVGQVQDNQFLYLGTTSGSADAYTLAPSPAITAYATTQQFTVKISATNLTTTPYLQISAIANPTTTAVIKKLSATKTEIAVEASDLLANGIYKFQRNSANDAWIVLNPEKPFYNFTNGTKATSTSQGIVYLQQNQNFTIKNNNGDINNYIEFPAQLITTSTKSGLGGNLIKRLNASWVVGNNVGGLFSSTKAANTFYYCFAIINDTDGSVDYGFDTSPIAANRPTGYTNYEYKGCFLTNASSNIRPFLQVKDYFFLSEDVFEPSITPPSTFTTITFSAIPKINNIIGMLNFSLTYSGGTVTGLALNTRTTGDTTSNGRRAQYTATNGFDAIGLTTYQPMNNLGQIDVKAEFSSPVTNLNLATQGWIDANINI